MALSLQFKIDGKDPELWLVQAEAEARRLAGRNENFVDAEVCVLVPVIGKLIMKKAGSEKLVLMGR